MSVSDALEGGAWGQGALPGGQAGCLDADAINPAYSIGFSSDIIEPAGHFLISTAPRQTPESPPAATSNTRAAKKWPIGQKNDGPDRVEVFFAEARFIYRVNRAQPFFLGHLIVPSGTSSRVVVLNSNKWKVPNIFFTGNADWIPLGIGLVG